MHRSTLARLSTHPHTDSQIDHCNLMEMISCTCFVFSRASIALLMYFRVCAVYNMNRIVVLFFGFIWLGVVASAATTFGSLEGIYIGPTKYCTMMVKHDYLISASFICLVNDTLIFLAIMYKLGMANIRRSPTSQISTAWKPTGRLQSFTRVFLQDSQIYYSWVEPHLHSWCVRLTEVIILASLSHSISQHSLLFSPPILLPDILFDL